MSVQQPRWRPTGRIQWTTVIVAVVATLGVLSYLVHLGYDAAWTGLGQAKVQAEVRPAKTLWEWLGLLIVPAMLATGGYFLNRWQTKRDAEIRQAQKDHENRIQQAQEEHEKFLQQREKEREELAARQRAQDEMLRAYLDQMSDLMVDRKMREDPPQSDTHRLAQARTIATLLGLDKDHKRRPLKLVYELNLITKDKPLLNLKNAGLDTADLREITLRDTCLKEADLRLANLRGSDLRGSDLREADLRGANLGNADLSDTCLAGANLLPYDEMNPSKLNAPNLSNGTDANDIDLSDHHLIPADLGNANLSNADLTGVYLTGANLRGATGVTDQELEQQAASLKGAIMPNGQKYEDWLKTKERTGGEDGENTGPS
jgi:hypothetical protein